MEAKRSERAPYKDTGSERQRISQSNTGRQTTVETSLKTSEWKQFSP